MAPSTPKHAILYGLNDAQRRAVTSDAATLAILAGPGSGKTHTLTARVAWLIDHVGYQPEDIIVATFTVKAAREMKDRIGKALGNGREKKLILGTFHSIARRYLTTYGRHIGLSPKFGIADENDSRTSIERICKRLQLAVDPRAARTWISKKKAQGTEAAAKPTKGPAKAPGQQEVEFGTCYQEYQSHLEKSNLLDYDDLLVRCVELLRQFPRCVSNIQTVLVDEYQDTNGIQYELMKLLAQQHWRITTVGDPDQSIYGWRSAEIKNLRRMFQEFGRTVKVSLEENYRSSQSILHLSMLVIKQDENRFDKGLKPVHDKGSRPVLRRLKSAAAEADWIVLEIRRVLMMSGSMLTHNDVSILLRSASLSRHIESSLGKAGIAYRMVGGHKFYDRAEIRTLIDYLRVIAQPENNVAFARILNVPRRGFGEGTIKGLLQEAESSSLSVWALLSKHCRGDRKARTRITNHMEQKLSGGLLRPLEDIRRRIKDAPGPDGNPFGLVQMVEQLLVKLDFQKYLQTAHPDDHEQRWANVQEFLGLAAEFVRDVDNAEDDFLPEIEGLQQTKEIDVLPRFLANVSLAADAQTGDEGQGSKPHVTISTIHKAKGLEWPIVFVPAVYRSVFPHTRSEDDAEERRLLYVAMTRAQALLYLSCPLFNSNSNGERTELSPFVEPVKGSFLNKGPCLDRPVMEGIAKIIQRKLPAEETIFKGLPAMFSPEDNLFPVDPEEAKPGEGARAKRLRLQGPGHDGSEEVHWHGDYTTTMEGLPSFANGASHGFVSVGAHQAAITAANGTATVAQKAEKPKPSTNKRPADQKSIMGFVKTNSGPARTPSGPPAYPGPNTTLSRHPVVVERLPAPAQPAIDPVLAGHKLGAGKMMTRPSVTRDEQTAKRKQYTCFSSSPPRPAAANDDSSGKIPAAKPPEPTRPAAGLHATTSTLPKALSGGLRRPAGLGMEGIKPIERLRRPFKPLTINRS